MVEQSAAAARSLADEAADLSGLVGHFRTGAPTGVSGADGTKRGPSVRAARAPARRGNLALKPVPADDDWTEF